MKKKVINLMIRHACKLEHYACACVGGRGLNNIDSKFRQMCTRKIYMKCIDQSLSRLCQRICLVNSGNIWRMKSWT